MSNRDYSEQSTILSADFLTMLNYHPESFACLFFKSELSTAEVVAPDGVTDGVADVVGSIEGSERKIEYSDPVASRAMIVPDEGLSLFAFESGHGEDSKSGNDPVVILLKETTVPKQSIITWTEKTGPGDTDEKDVSFYVLESRPFGRAPVAGMKHYCIPLLSEGEQTGQEEQGGEE